VGVRLAGEAVNVTTPTATLGGEPLKAWLLTRYGIPLEDGLASVVVAKTALVLSQVAFLTLGVVVAVKWTAVAPALLRTMGVLAAAFALAVGGFFWAQQWGLVGASGRALGRLGAGLRVAGAVGRLDARVRRFYREARQRFGLSLLFHFFGWIAGGLEVWLTLGLLGAPVDPATAVAIEAFATAVRSAAFLVPASLGVQEGSLVGIFLAFGLSSGLGLAYGFVRRLREAVWTAAGYGLLATWRRLDRAPHAP
jgi:uncharacterized membrane protein YbhN (UPF0104 family)